MTKISTLENVLLNTRSQRNVEQSHTLIPSGESVKMLVRYSMALEIKRTRSSGVFTLILN